MNMLQVETTRSGEINDKRKQENGSYPLWDVAITWCDEHVMEVQMQASKT